MRYAWVHESLCRDERISNAQFRVLANLILHVDRDGYCVVSVGRLAKYLSRERSTIRHHLNGLVELGVINPGCDAAEGWQPRRQSVLRAVCRAPRSRPGAGRSPRRPT